MDKEMEISFNKQIKLAEVSVLSETIIGKNGLQKKIIKKGSSWQSPVPGDEVEVHYSVSVQEGDYFDLSRQKGTPFRFKLGQCEVIKGWDEGIATMRKGERAVFIIPPELAYGQTGSPPIIPPNSTLIFDIELISWYPIRDVSGDGGIMKKIIREGGGWATPNDADEVLVKYVAKCENGTVISKADVGLEFSLTSGHLCPAMSKAVKTMRKGEKAELSVKFSYGLRHCNNGTSTIDDAIPPYPNLTINLELLSWKTVVDIKGDKKILKKIMKKGEAFDRPNEGSLAKVVYTGKLEDGTIFERRGSNEEPFEYMCADEQINGDLDAAIMTMRKGEEAVVKISSDFMISVLYEIKLIDFIKEKPFWKMDTKERISACETKKDEGNKLFKAGKFKLASNKYEKECDLRKQNNCRHTKYIISRDIELLFFQLTFLYRFFNILQALKYVEYNHSFSDKEKVEGNSLRLSCYLNEAACKLKLGEYQEVTRLCSKVLELDSFNVKALFRRSQAYMRTSDLEKAEEDIHRALAIDPNNKDVKIKLKELREKQRQYVQYETKFFSHMISRIS